MITPCNPIKLCLTTTLTIGLCTAATAETVGTVGAGLEILNLPGANIAVDTSTDGSNDQSRQNIDKSFTETLGAGIYHGADWSYHAGQTGSVIPYLAFANGAGGYEILAFGAQVDIAESDLDVDVTVPFGGSPFSLGEGLTEVFGGIMNPPGDGSQNPIKTNLASGGVMDHDNNNDGAFTLPTVGGIVDGFGHANLGRSYAFSIDIATGGDEASILEGLVAHWNFDNNFDDSAGIFNGEARGDVTFVDNNNSEVDGLGKAIRLNGVDQYVEITGGDENVLDFEGGDLSVAGWFRAAAFDKSWQAVIAKGEGNRWRVARRGDGDRITYAGGTGDTGDEGPNVNDGQWHHFVAISDSTKNTQLWIDGDLAVSNESVPTLENGDKNLMIGNNPDSTGRSFNGEIDEVALWNRVLTPNEVAELATTSIAFIIDPPPEFGYAGIDSRANGVTVRIKDREGFVVQTDSVKMIIDGEEVAVTVTKDGDTTSIAHSSAPDFFPSESFHTYRIAADSTTGGSHSIEEDFTSVSYRNVDSANLVDGVDTSNGGFRIFAFQTVAAGRNRIFWSEEALRGEQGANIADMSVGPDLDRDGFGDLGQSGVNGFTDPTVINYEAVATNPSGDFQDDTYTHPILSDAAAPGIKSALESDNQNYSQHEITTYIHFPTRDVYTMGVNSDDGFKLSVAGSNRDVLGQVLGFGGGGIFHFLIEEPGIYPMRLLWYNGTGGSHVEWYSVRDDGVKVLINDRDTEGALFAYYDKSGGERARVTSASVMNKLMQADILSAAEAIEITLEDGITEVDPASVSLTINGSDEGVTLVKTGSNTTVGIESLEAYADSDIVIRFEYGDGSTHFVHSFNAHVTESEIGRPPTVGAGPGILDVADANNTVDTSTTGDNDQSRQNVDITHTKTLEAGAYQATSWSYQAGQTGSVIPYVASANGAGGYEILAVGAQVDIDENGLDINVTVPFGGSPFTLEAKSTEIFGGIMNPPGIGSQNPIKTNLASGGFMDHDNNNDGASTLPTVGGIVDGFGHANLGRSYAFSIEIEPAGGPVVVPTPTLDILFQGGNIVLTYEGTLLGADQIEGPYEVVDGAISPMTVAPNEARRFYQSSN